MPYIATILSKAYQRFYLLTIGKFFPTDFFSHRHVASAKAILLLDGKVVLLKNEHGQWDLPGGKVHNGENPASAIVRECKEELGIDIEVQSLKDIFQVRVLNRINVMVILFECFTNSTQEQLLLSHEHFDIGLFTSQEIMDHNLLPDYKGYVSVAGVSN